MTELKGKYRHFKGGEYKIIGIALHTDDLTELVLYKSLYDSKEFPKGTIWARPKTDFLGTKTIDGKEIKRFEKID